MWAPQSQFLLAAIATWFDTNGIATVNIKQSLFGFLACGGAMLICFVCFQIGGGDVKLIAMIGAFIGPDFGIQVLLWTFVLGAGAAAILLAWKLGTVNLALRLLRQLLSRLEFGNWQPLTVEEKNQLQLKLYLAPYALLAFVIVRLSSNGSLIV